MTPIQAGPAALRRLLRRGELVTLLEAIGPLLPGALLRVRDLDGALVAESGDDAAAEESPTWAGPLRLGDAPVGSLELCFVAPGPATGGDAGLAAGAEPWRDDLERGAHALLTVLEQALAGGALRRELAAETLERYREVHLAYRVGEVLAAGFDLERLPRRVLDEAVRVVRAAAALLVLDEAGGARVTAVRGIVADDPEALEALAATRAVAAPGRSAIDVVTAVEAGARGQHPAAHAVRLWAPLQAGDRTLGGVLLTRPAGDAVFSAGDAKLLAALAAQAATYVDNARLHQAALEQARWARELQLAHEVQARLMPNDLPGGDGWDLAAWWSAAREVAGDFYDATRQGALLAVTIGDVADKGMAAALFMALTRSVLRASAGDGRGPGDVLTRANALLCADASDGMFVTLAHAQLFPDGAVRYANGGHNPPLLVRSDGSVDTLPRTGILVGWDDTARYGEAELGLSPGDTLVLYTDGVTEARSESGSEYGEERLRALLRTLVPGGASADAVVRAIRSDLDDFVGSAEAFDDATVLVARRQAGAREPGRGAHGGRAGCDSV